MGCLRVTTRFMVNICIYSWFGLLGSVCMWLLWKFGFSFLFWPVVLNDESIRVVSGRHMYVHIYEYGLNWFFLDFLFLFFGIVVGYREMKKILFWTDDGYFLLQYGLVCLVVILGLEIVNHSSFSILKSLLCEIQMWNLGLTWVH